MARRCSVCGRPTGDDRQDLCLKHRLEDEQEVEQVIYKSEAVGDPRSTWQYWVAFLVALVVGVGVVLWAYPLVVGPSTAVVSSNVADANTAITASSGITNMISNITPLAVIGVTIMVVIQIVLRVFANVEEGM